MFQVGINSITYAGNHGLEILHPDGSRFVHPMPIEFEDKVRGLLKQLQEHVCFLPIYLFSPILLKPLCLRIAIIFRFAEMVHGWKTKELS